MTLKPRSRFRALIWPMPALLALFFFALTSCFETPGVKDPTRKIASFSHTGGETSCTICHENKRPIVNSKSTSTSSLSSWKTGIHGDGADCISCHRPSNSWLNGLIAFNHSPVPNSCASCHSKDRPSLLINKFDHNSYGQGDCISCHLSGVGKSWKGGTFSHNPAPGSCSSCHNPQRPTVLVNNFNHSLTSSTDCVSCHTKNIGINWTQGTYNHTPTPTTCVSCHASKRPTTIVNNFDHSKFGTGDCVSCHTKNIGLSWASATFNHSPTPTSCATCHETKRPAPQNGVPHGNNLDCVSCHIPGPDWMQGMTVYTHNPVPTTCANCHDSKRPTTLVNGFDHVKYGMGDCVSCHVNNVGVNWTQANYNHSPVPNTCSTCHEASRPAVLVNGFDHKFAGSGDCVSCHLSGVGKTWKSGYYSHSPAPATCANCHSDTRPTTIVNSFDHKVSGMGDCISCHKSGMGKTWAGGQFSHSPTPTTCSTCHASKRPTTTINGFSHSLYGTGDCVSCHKVNIGSSWAGAQWSHTPTPTTCANCHSSERPTTIVSGFDHTKYGMGDCVSCHKVNIGSSWSGGAYSHSPVPTSCNNCHEASRPTLARYPSGGTATGHYKAKDCYTCHLPKSSTVTLFKFSHTNAANKLINFCLPCHYTEGWAKHKNSGSVSFTGDGNCYNCHRSNRPFDNPI